MVSPTILPKIVFFLSNHGHLSYVKKNYEVFSFALELAIPNKPLCVNLRRVCISS